VGSGQWAVAFAADDFCADESAAAAKIIGERQKGVATADSVAGAVDVEDEMVAHGGRKKLNPRSLTEG
jgi:hypothetical protein